MQDTVCTRLAPVVEAAMAFDGSPDFNFGGQGLSFVHSAFTELSECRSVLRHSYAFSYFRYPTFSRTAHIYPHLYGKRKEKQGFDNLQAGETTLFVFRWERSTTSKTNNVRPPPHTSPELEVLTEQMSDIVARSHLRATQVQIAFLTAGAAEKRVELSNMVFQIYHDEKKEIARYQKRKENEEKLRAKSSGNDTEKQIAAMHSLSELMAMHQRPRGHPLDDGGLAQALDGFLARVENHGSRRLDFDDLAPETVRMWACPRCTYVNDSGRVCAMCAGRRS